MIRIDLAKDEFEKDAGGKKTSVFQKIELPATFKRFVPRLNILSIIVVGVSVALALLPHLFFTQYMTFVELDHQKKLQEIKTKLSQINEEISKLASLKSELESYEQQKKVVSQKLTTVRDLLSARGTPVNVLDALGQGLPRNTWLTSVDLKLGDGTLGLNGKAYTNEEISDYLDRLAESIYLSDVKLESVIAEIKDKVTIKVFVITAKPKTQG